MTLTDDELHSLARCSAWLVSDEEDPDEETKKSDKKALKLHLKLVKFYQQNNKKSYTLK
jgi:hypothetical protein